MGASGRSDPARESARAYRLPRQSETKANTEYKQDKPTAMNEKYALGVDIGGSHIACLVVELGSSRPVGETYTEVKIA